MTVVIVTLLATRVGGVPQGRHGMGLRGQPLEVVDEAIAGILGILVMHADVDRFLRADLLAVSAEDAPELVDLVDQRVPIAGFVLARHQLDAVGRTDLRTEAAGNALGTPLLGGQHPMRAAPPGGDAPIVGALRFGILHRHASLQHVLERQRHALERRPDVRHLPLRSRHHLHADRHQAAPSRGDIDDAARVRGATPRTTRPRSSRKNIAQPSSRLSANRANPCAFGSVHPRPAWMISMATATTMMYASESGSRIFQPSAMSWSYRKRGSVQRIHITKKIQKNVLAKKHAPVTTVWSSPPRSSQWVNGMSQPPKNRVATIAATVTICAYSAIMNSENFIALYSEWYPATSSDSASGRSNGSRFVSANPEIRKMKNDRNRGMMNQRPCCWRAMIALNDAFPDTSSTGISDSP